MLAPLLHFAHEHATRLKALSVRAASKSTIHYALRSKTKAYFRGIIEYYATRAQVLKRLDTWVALYAARQNRAHPGWEGLRLVCDKGQSFTQTTIETIEKPNAMG
jgi:hypothetical protein